MNPTLIVDGVYDVGVVDWNIRNFHGYSTDSGTSYNSFLIIDEKIVLVDTVKSCFSDMLISNISKIIDPRNIDLVISNHAEMDHSGGLPAVMDLIGKSKPIYSSVIGARNLFKHFGCNWNFQLVKDGDELNIGHRTLSFLEAKMLHWPDSMFTYLSSDDILFSSDGFGQHYASFYRFDDQLKNEMVWNQAKKYFANILLPYASRITYIIEKILKMKLNLKMICPDHGIIWRKNTKRIIDSYLMWSHQKPMNKAVVVYDTMWGSTKLMAEAIATGINIAGVNVEPICISASHRSDIVTELLDAGAIIVGSPTLNNQIFPTVSDVLVYIKGLRFVEKKIAAAFGSYGWSGEAIKHISRELKSMGFDLVDDGIKIQYVPNKKDLVESIEYGKKIGMTLKDFIKNS